MPLGGGALAVLFACHHLSYRFTLHLDSIGGVNNAVENGVGNGAVTDEFMPYTDVVLAGDHGLLAIASYTSWR